jgi:hypothetical protein
MKKLNDLSKNNISKFDENKNSNEKFFPNREIEFSEEKFKELMQEEDESNIQF